VKILDLIMKIPNSYYLEIVGYHQTPIDKFLYEGLCKDIPLDDLVEMEIARLGIITRPQLGLSVVALPLGWRAPRGDR